jgi:hypothetical protein
MVYNCVYYYDTVRFAPSSRVPCSPYPPSGLCSASIRSSGPQQEYVCITIIDTIILNIHTNDAYTYDTNTPWGLCSASTRSSGILV